MEANGLANADRLIGAVHLAVVTLTRHRRRDRQQRTIGRPVRAVGDPDAMFEQRLRRILVLLTLGIERFGRVGAETERKSGLARDQNLVGRHFFDDLVIWKHKDMMQMMAMVRAWQLR